MYIYIYTYIHVRVFILSTTTSMMMSGSGYRPAWCATEAAAWREEEERCVSRRSHRHPH